MFSFGKQHQNAIPLCCLQNFFVSYANYAISQISIIYESEEKTRMYNNFILIFMLTMKFQPDFHYQRYLRDSNEYIVPRFSGL